MPFLLLNPRCYITENNFKQSITGLLIHRQTLHPLRISLAYQREMQNNSAIYPSRKVHHTNISVAHTFTSKTSMHWRRLDATGGCSLRRHNGRVWCHGVIRVDRHRRWRCVTGSRIHCVHRPKHHTRQVVGGRGHDRVATIVCRRSRHWRLAPNWADARQWPVVSTAARSARRRATSAVNVVREAVKVKHSASTANSFFVARQRSLHGHITDVIGKCDQRKTIVFRNVSALYRICCSRRPATRSWRRTTRQSRWTDTRVARLETSLQCYGQHHENKQTKNRTRRGDHDCDRIGAQVAEVRTADDKVHCKTEPQASLHSQHKAYVMSLYNLLSIALWHSYAVYRYLVFI